MFLKDANPPKLTQEEIRSLRRHNKQGGWIVVKNFPQRNALSLMTLFVNSTNRESTATAGGSSKTQKKTLPNSFYEANITKKS